MHISGASARKKRRWLSAKTALQAEYAIEAVCENQTCRAGSPKLREIERERVTEREPDGPFIILLNS